MTRTYRLFSLSIASALLVASPPAWAEPGSGGGSDAAARADQVAEKAAEDLAKVEERAAKDAARYAEERAKIEADASKDPAKAAEDLAKLDADAAKWEADRAAESAKIETELAEEEAKIREDAVENSERVESVSSDMSQLGATENPDRDDRGFPVRRGEVSVLDIRPDGLARAEARGFRVIERIDLDELGRSLMRLAVPPGMSGPEGRDVLRSIDRGATVDFTHYYGMQPAGERMEAGADARLSRRPGAFTLGMIDTAVAPHDFLRGISVRRKAFGAGNAAAPDHGTAVASILASEGARRIASANVFRAGADGAPFTSAEAIAKALEWLVEQHVPVINMSLAGPRNAILDVMIVRALRRGTAVVASAGNGGATAPPAYPAALSNVVAVTAVDASNRVYRYANQGRYITVAAQGVREPAAASRGGFGYFSGTSFATPHVAAWMARCIEGTRRQAVDARRCRSQMIASARDLGAPGFDPVFGYGLIGVR